MGMRRTALGIVVALGALALPAAASAQDLAPVYVGESLGKGTTQASIVSLTALALVPKSDEVRVRVAFFVPCRGGGERIRASQMLVRVTREGNAFKGKRSIGNFELGNATLTIAGTLGAGGGDGTLRVTSTSKKAGRCDTGVRTFTARPVDPAAKPETTGVVPGAAVLLGVTDQGTGTPYPFAARTSADGRRIDRMIFVMDEDGTYRYGSRVYDSVWDIEFEELRLAIAGNRVTDRWDDPYRNRAKDFSGRRRGSFVGQIGSGGLTATASHHASYRERGYSHQYGVSNVHITAAFVT
jgi:hypothetical protein